MLTKMVNGVQVVMSAEEESIIRGEWATNDAKAADLKVAAVSTAVDEIINNPAQLAALKAALSKQ